MNPTHFPQPSCELCGLTFREQEDLHSHMSGHTDFIEVEQKVLDCMNCRKTFLTFDDMDRHNRKVHSLY